MLAGLLYAQSLLGLVAVAALVSKNAGSWTASGSGYGVASAEITLALSAKSEPTGRVWRE